ncbi:MAG: hypothetical protein PW845_04010 [Pseudomonas sp.]|uniref:hypothetical protein n=1 Tax=Pseudomonas abieticivorans TaxID=2931382 RepID=UPI0020BFFDF4|nr:hypothetical protein [Pseudomonas sp. PIA16]MDE1164549.1 hypothetical protein [Pseudomonas sp.]
MDVRFMPSPVIVVIRRIGARGIGEIGFDHQFFPRSSTKIKAAPPHRQAECFDFNRLNALIAAGLTLAKSWLTDEPCPSVIQ